MEAEGGGWCVLLLHRECNYYSCPCHKSPILIARKPTLFPPLAVSNFVDLSGVGRSEGTLFYKLLQRLADKMTGPKEIPIKFLSLARNNLARAPYSTLNLIGHTLEYLSLAGNNFSVLNASIIKGMCPCVRMNGVGIELLSNLWFN